MIRFLLAAGVFALAQFGSADVAQAAARAFIVGNSDYVHTQKLPNAANDATDIAQKLRQMGYVVTIGLNWSRGETLRAFAEFQKSLAKDDLAFVYYAGHGVQIGGENYLMPVDAKIDSEDEAKTKLVAVNALLSDLSRATTQRIVILDACRNNPFANASSNPQVSRSVGATRGLARVYAGVGTFVGYSTQPGNVALDGSGRNSPFAGSLLRHIGASDSDVHRVMRRVRADVQKATDDKQIPWENSSLIEDLAFAPGGAPAQPAKQAAPPVAKQTPPPSAEQYHYVSGLDPNGDNFLALRSTAGGDAVRIATMASGTLLRVTGESGVWRRVVLLDGTAGWAHGNWIACCKTIAGRPPGPAPSVPQPASSGDSCDSLWKRRNAIWHRHGYCFTTARGKEAFGNAGCSRDQPAARAAMSSGDRDTIDALVARESAMGCN